MPFRISRPGLPARITLICLALEASEGIEAATRGPQEEEKPTTAAKGRGEKPLTLGFDFVSMSGKLPARSLMLVYLATVQKNKKRSDEIYRD